MNRTHRDGRIAGYIFHRNISKTGTGNPFELLPLYMIKISANQPANRCIFQNRIPA